MVRLLTYAAFFLCAATARAETVTVFAAASLKTAMDEIAAVYPAPLTLSFAGSSALARQIDRGAPADVFISASPDWMDVLDDAGRLAPGTRRDLLGNSIVVIGGTPGPVEVLTPQTDLLGWLDGGKLAMALVDAVPAGQYGKAALLHLGLWEAVAPQVAQADNVRAALALVAIGAAPYGIVYATDANAEPRVHIRATIPGESHPPIRYPAAAIDGREDAAQPFLDFLASDPARAIFEAQGFTVLAD